MYVNFVSCGLCEIVNKVFDIVSFLCLLGWWIQHKVRLGKFMRDSDSLQREGENLQAVWSPDAKLIAVLVSAILISHVFLVLYANWPNSNLHRFLFTLCIAHGFLPILCLHVYFLIEEVLLYVFMHVCICATSNARVDWW